MLSTDAAVDIIDIADVESLILGSDFSCASAGDGLHADPSDCSKFIQCHAGQEYNMSCQEGLVFNPTHKVCDWPQNVDCP